MNDTNDAFRRCIRSLEALEQCRKAELQKLCENPTVFNIAQELTDAMLGNLTYLCNFPKITGGNGKEYPILEVSKRLEKDILEKFKQLTGKDYTHEVVRHLHFRRKLEKKLLDAIMEPVEEKELPSLTDEEKKAIKSLPNDFVDRLFRVEETLETKPPAKVSIVSVDGNTSCWSWYSDAFDFGSPLAQLPAEIFALLQGKETLHRFIHKDYTTQAEAMEDLKRATQKWNLGRKNDGRAQ